jgi:hypothetical protein
MNFKQKLLVTSVLASLTVTPAFANGITSLDDLIDDAIDVNDKLVSVVSGAFNFSSIDASVNLNAYTIDLNSPAASATATANANVTSTLTDAAANVTAIANAVSGNSINTTAIGAYNNTDVTVDNAVNLAVAIDGDIDGTLSLVNFGGTATGLNADVYDVNNLNINLFSVAENGDVDVKENGIGVFQTAFNAADINASVNITAAAPTINSFWDRNRDFAENTIALSNISITTTAIGAYNQGVMDITNGLSQTLTIGQLPVTPQ